MLIFHLTLEYLFSVFYFQVNTCISLSGHAHISFNIGVFIFNILFSGQYLYFLVAMLIFHLTLETEVKKQSCLVYGILVLFYGLLSLIYFTIS